MAREELPLALGEGRAASRFVSSRTLVNCFLEPSGGRLALYGGPGFTLRKTLDTLPLRGIYPFGDVLIAVSGDRLYTVTEGGTATDRGNIETTGPVDISDNGLQAVIVGDTKSYALDGTTYALTQITDADLGQLTSIDFSDQYMIGSVANSGRFQISALADGTSWDALDVATAEARPDNLWRVWVDNRDLLLMGKTTIEGQYNSGASPFPFERSQLFLEIGLAGRDCVAAVDNSVAFLANDGTVRIIRGGTAVVISTPAIADIIASWTVPGNAQAFSFTLRNHSFWVLRHAEGCVMWDASLGGNPEQAWSVRKSYGSDTWRIAYAANIWSKTIFGDADTGKLYTMDVNTHAEADDPLVRELVSMAMGPGGVPFTLNGVEILFEPGVGIVTGQGSDPEVWMQLSRNSGRTFGARVTRKLGARGNYEKRIIWQSGYGQFRPEGGVISLGCSDPVPFVLKQAFADFTPDSP